MKCFSLTGICASISEAVVRAWSERQAGEEWEAVRGRASLPETGERNLPAAGGQSALRVRSQPSTPLHTFSGTATTESRSLLQLMHRSNYQRCLFSSLVRNQATKTLYRIKHFEPKTQSSVNIFHVFESDDVMLFMVNILRCEYKKTLILCSRILLNKSAI